jgi:hypothetical protein
MQPSIIIQKYNMQLGIILWYHAVDDIQLGITLQTQTEHADRSAIFYVNSKLTSTFNAVLLTRNY